MFYYVCVWRVGLIEPAVLGMEVWSRCTKAVCGADEGGENRRRACLLCSPASKRRAPERRLRNEMRPVMDAVPGTHSSVTIFPPSLVPGLLLDSQSAARTKEELTYSLALNGFLNCSCVKPRGPLSPPLFPLLSPPSFSLRSPSISSVRRIFPLSPHPSFRRFHQ